MGIGAAVVPGCALAVIMEVFPRAEQAKAIGAWSMAAGVGIGAGPVLGGALLGHFWWGSLLLANVPITLVAVVIIAAVVPDNRVSGTRRLDVPGVLLSVVGFGLVVYGLIKGGEESDWLGCPVVAPLVAGIAALILLGLVEGRMRDPSIDLAMFRNRVFSIGTGILAATFLVATGAASFVMIFYIQLVRGFSPLESGLLTLPMAVGSMLAGMRSARLLTRYGPAVVLTASSLLMAEGCVGYGAMDEHTSLWLFGIVHALFGFGFGATFAAAMAVAGSVIPPAKSGSGAALLNSIRQVGTALGVAVLGSILTSEYRHHVGDAVAVLPPSVRGEAAASLGDTMRVVAANHPDQGARLLTQANGAFLDAMQTAVWVAAGVSATAAIAAARLSARRGRHRRVQGWRRLLVPVESATGTVAAGQSRA
jgi:MFS family permease